MKINKLINLFFVIQFIALNSQIQPNIIIKNNMNRPIYYYIVTNISPEKRVTPSTIFTPIKPKEVVQSFRDLSTNPEIYIKASESDTNAFDISIKRETDKRNKVINLIVNDLDYSKGISLVKGRNNFTENELMLEKIRLATASPYVKGDPYKILSVLYGFNVTASSPSYSLLGSAYPDISINEINQRYETALKKIEYLKKGFETEQLYSKIKEVIDNAIVKIIPFKLINSRLTEQSTPRDILSLQPNIYEPRFFDIGKTRALTSINKNFQIIKGMKFGNKTAEELKKDAEIIVNKAYEKLTTQRER
ncbi:hypothetical protein M1446_00665 [Candidatus Dependentiae bacterium]|nr:hypothetical protein [Candidatus Dependentiae bacterium]